MMKIYSIAQPQFDDVEAEILCLLIMHFRPNKIYEFSPCGGWSTMYMLNSLLYSNNISAKIQSYDIHDKSCNLIKKFDKLLPLWDFHLGDVLKEFKNFDLNMDFLFIDSDHSGEFAKKYIEDLLEPLLYHTKKNRRRVLVSVHDVFHEKKPKINEEGEIVINFLDNNNIKYFSPNNIEHCSEIEDLRYNSDTVCPNIHFAQFNSGIFFILE